MENSLRNSPICSDYVSADDDNDNDVVVTVCFI